MANVLNREIESEGPIEGLWWVVSIEVRTRTAEEGRLTTDLTEYVGNYAELSVTVDGYRYEGSRSKRSDRGCVTSGAYHELKGEPRIDRIMELARRWHLNGLRSGTTEQQKAVKEALEGRRYDYGEACEALKERGLYEVSGPHGVKYRYGHKWLLEVLPEAVIDELRTI